MRLKIMSDLHFEMHQDAGDSFLEHTCADRTDVLIIPGDLADYALLLPSVEKICNAYKHALVIFVPGNHEFYGSDIPTTLRFLYQLAGKFDNFRFLYNGRLDYKGVKFFGTTLWFKHIDNIERLYPQMNDFYRISMFEQQVYPQNQAALDFLWQSDLTNSVVITHMLPSMKSVALKFLTSELNPFFVCEVDNLILRKKPRYWFHGHAHRSADYMLGNTRVVCNPMGYVRRDYNLDFNYELLINI